MTLTRQSVFENSTLGETKLATEKNSLEICTLGQFSVKRGGRHLTNTTGYLNKSWILFLYLITHRHKLTPLETIHELLWASEECPDPKKNVKNLVQRLRKILDIDNNTTIVYSQGCYRWNNNIPYWLDIEIFEALCHEARVLLKNDSRKAAAKYKEALDIYQGDYLPELSGEEWVIPARRYFHQLYIRSFLELLSIYKANCNFDEIASLCEKAFLIDQFEEELHLRYMEALLKLGKTSKARAHYQYITSLLYHEFGAKPSEAFRRMNSLMKSKENNLDFDFGEFKKSLSRYDSMEGALHCEADMFALMCRVENRRARRESSPVCLSVITLTSPDYRLPPPKELQESMEKLKNVIIFSLRDGDYFSRWNESQYAILLKGLDFELAKKVSDRIKNKATDIIKSNTVVVRTKIYPYFVPDSK